MYIVFSTYVNSMHSVVFLCFWFEVSNFTNAVVFLCVLLCSVCLAEFS